MNSYKYETEVQMDEEYKHLIESVLTEDSVKRILHIIRYFGEDAQDDETAHLMEKGLYAAVLKQIDTPLARLALESSKFEFSRWFA